MGLFFLIHNFTLSRIFCIRSLDQDEILPEDFRFLVFYIQLNFIAIGYRKGFAIRFKSYYARIVLVF